MEAVQEQRRLSSKRVSVRSFLPSGVEKPHFMQTVYLVGGFSASDYLFSQVQERLQSQGFSVYRPDAYL